MKKALAPLLLLAIGIAPALASAQERYGLSIALDIKGKATPVAAATVRTYHDVLTPRLDLDLKGLVKLEDNLGLGFALTKHWAIKWDPAHEIKLRGGLDAGPWLNYGTGTGKLNGGLYLGFGVSW